MVTIHFIQKYTISVIQALVHSFICYSLFNTPSFIKDVTQDEFQLNHLISSNSFRLKMQTTKNGLFM